ncbi:LytTR family transcriptional regulator DNA-binding domain-containing protein [Flexithrix dorotheae]|uniref:LytTR family transcriptional regulator DNA-binding domain-containing protein n=1 Tax=Flexithrix dorotheae TaxID=70993 RepID=UPI00037F91FB|nr:LytTR family transcriptional regulator DNA-binding domain-containing protein [Flexithrix dorotheae]
MKDSLWLTTSRGKHERIKISEVYWIEIQNDEMLVKLASKEALIKVERKLKKVFASAFLDFPEIFKVHPSFLINLDHADLIENNKIQVKGKYFPIEQKVKRMLEEKLNLVVF